MSNATRLPAPMVIACYCAAGFCLFVSFGQMTQIFSAQGVEVGRAPLLPAAILIGGCVCWRLSGHLIRRQAGIALVAVMLAAIYVEFMSVSTSTMALAIGHNERVQADIEQSDQHQTAAATSAAAGRAVASLADDLERMPSNYYKAGRQTAEQIERLIDKQTALAAMQADTGQSATAQAFGAAGDRLGMSGDDMAFAWALGIALAISLIPLAIQISLGTLSDSELMSRPSERVAGRQSDDSGTGPTVSTEGQSGNVRSLSSVQ